MMLAYRLVRLIENHSEALASGLLKKLQGSEAAASYQNVPPEELKQSVFEIYRHLGTGCSAKASSTSSNVISRSALAARSNWCRSASWP